MELAPAEKNRENRMHTKNLLPLGLVFVRPQSACITSRDPNMRVNSQEFN